MPGPAFPLATDNDFVTLDQAKTWIESMKPFVPIPDDDVLHFLISGVSQDMLARMSRPSIFKSDYQEWYDGTGSATLPIDQNPIISVNILKINGLVVQPSPDHMQSGYIISRDRKFIQLVGSPGISLRGSVLFGGYSRRCGNIFPFETSNVYIDYYAGYETIPYDLAEACLLVIAQDYLRRGWPDRAQIAIPQGGGTTTYRNWEVPPRVQRILNTYTRTYRL